MAPPFSSCDRVPAEDGDSSAPRVRAVATAMTAATAAQARLKQQIVAQTQFIQLLTHQLATPLTSLQGSVGLLRETDLPPAHRLEFLAMVQQQVQRLSHLLADMATLRHAEMDELAPRLACFSLRELVAEVSQDFAAPGGAHRFCTDLPSDLPELLGDRWQISQVLVNLISNAIKYSPPDAPVEIGARLLPNHSAEVWVQDRGLGIPAADQPRVFEPFFRVQHGDRQGIEGTGLGLSLCQLLVEKQGGTLNFESVHGQGSRFYFTLPTVVQE